jgi:putative MATE family efflux protein
VTSLGLPARHGSEDRSAGAAVASMVDPQSGHQPSGSGQAGAGPQSGVVTGAARKLDPRTERMLRGKIVPTLLIMAGPNTAMMVAQSSIALFQIWFVSRLGIASLAGISLVFPGWMMMQVLSTGSLGGGISSAVARALGGGNKADADAVAWHVVIISLAIGALFGGLVLAFGRPMYRALGGSGGSLEEALLYSNIIFAGMPLIWLTNGLASVIRGTGNMTFPAAVLFLGPTATIALFPPLIFGLGPMPGMGIAGAAVAILLTTIATVGALIWYLLTGRAVVRLTAMRLRGALFFAILRAGTIASISALQTSCTIVLLTALVGRTAGPDAVAGYGIGARLEYQLLGLVFGIGAPLVAIVGTNIGAGQRERAVRAALVGGGVAFLVCESIGIFVAIWPDLWLGLFSHDPRMLESGEAYLQYAGPGYGFLALGVALFFASQGAARLGWPVFAGFLRMAIAVLGAWAAWLVTHDLRLVFGVLCLAWIVYGLFLAVAIRTGVWFRKSV